MKRLAPVDTGALRNSITYTIQGDQMSINMLYYGAFQNYGVNGAGQFGANKVEFGVQPRPSSEPFYAFKTRQFGLRAQPFFNMDTITNQIADAFADAVTEQL